MSNATKTDPTKTLSLPALIAMVVGSVVGAGIFSLPSNMASVPTAPGPLIIGWLVTGVGMLSLTLTFQFLSDHAEDPAAGLHGYARDGFGRLVGFFAAWGYWMTAWIGNLAYFVLVASTLGLFFPIFGDGTNWWSIALGTVMLIAYNALLLQGVTQASVVNTVVTVAKTIPLMIFLVVVIINFDPSVLTADFWGQAEGLGSSFGQIKGIMAVTVFAFLGIEGASIFARHAKKPADVGRATVTGFIVVLALYIAVTLLSSGIMSRAELAELQDPSLAGILESLVGQWGSAFIAIGLLISIGGALLTWQLLCAEILASTSKDGDMPQSFGTERRPDVPAVSIILTAIITQFGLLYVHFAGGNYLSIIYMASSLILIPYLLSAGYAVKLALAGKASPVHYAAAVIAVVYGVWLLYAAGLNYLLMSAVFYCTGLGVHTWSRRERDQPVFASTGEWTIAGVVVLATVIAVTGLSSGWLTV